MYMNEKLIARYKMQRLSERTARVYGPVEMYIGLNDSDSGWSFMVGLQRCDRRFCRDLRHTAQHISGEN